MIDVELDASICQHLAMKLQKDSCIHLARTALFPDRKDALVDNIIDDNHHNAMLTSFDLLRKWYEIKPDLGTCSTLCGYLENMYKEGWTAVRHAVSYLKPDSPICGKLCDLVCFSDSY